MDFLNTHAVPEKYSDKKFVYNEKEEPPIQ
jgi:hypothetical protein